MDKLYSSLTIITLGLSLSSLTVNSSFASPLNESQSQNIEISELVIENRTYEIDPDITFRSYMLGKVVSLDDKMFSVTVENGDTFEYDDVKFLSAYPDLKLGDNVLLGVDRNGEYYLVSGTESEWDSILEKDEDVERSLMVSNYLDGKDVEIQNNSSKIETTTTYERKEIETEANSDLDNDDNMTVETEPVRGLW